MDFHRLYTEKKTRIEDTLKTLIDSYRSYPPTIFKAMEYSLFAGGKRLRPVLVISAHQLVGGNLEESLAMACGMEMIHTYSLIHDDLPAMDDDALRRGIPTNHKVFGEGLAILAGDALLNLAFEVILKNALKYPNNLENHVKAGFIIATAAGVEGMIGGQVVDLEYEGKLPEPDTVEYIHSHKTGALIEASLKAGVVLEGVDEKTEKAISQYGKRLGMAFQITDDILDIKGDISKLGKKLGRDKVKEKATFPAVYGLEKSQNMARELIEQAVVDLNQFGKSADFLREMARFVINRQG